MGTLGVGVMLVFGRMFGWFVLLLVQGRGEEGMSGSCSCASNLVCLIGIRANRK